MSQSRFASDSRITRHGRFVSVVVPAYNGARTLPKVLGAIGASDYDDFECVVVNDCSTDDTVAVAEGLGARVVTLDGGPYGPAHARNRGVEHAKGDIVFFVDADVVIQPDTISKVAETFAERDDIDAMFGSYDDSPEVGDFSSQFKNLFHHFVHQTGDEQAVTFWSGCGAVRRDVFLEVGGFDGDRYARPSIEDIELGARLRAAGHNILVNKNVQVKHLKHWTLRHMLKADIFDRAVPWTQLIMRERNLPNDLNLRVSQRLSALLVYLMLAHLAVSAFFHNIIALPFLAALFIVAVSYWNPSGASAPLSRISKRAEVASYALIAVVIGVVAYLGMWSLTAPMALLVFGFVAGRLIPGTNSLLKSMLFLALVLGVLSGIGVMVMNFEIWLWLPLVTMLLAVTALNFRLYLFFAKKRGIPFAMAVVPFHLLYYFYSVGAFAATAGLQTIDGYVRRRT